MLPRTAQTLNTLAAGNESITELHSAALALALTRYIDVEIEGEPDLREAVSEVMDEIGSILPLDLGAVYQYAYAIHQYRRTVMEGYFPNAAGGTDTTWLFGMNYYMSKVLMGLLSSPALIPVYRKYISVLNDIVDVEAEGDDE